jgi:hypothetical protein
MLHIKCQEHYELTKKYAVSIGREKEFTESLSRLNKMGEVVEIYKDFAPYSFYFVAFINGKRNMEGGLIYHGFDGGDGSEPSYSVTLTPTIGWSIHT